MCVAYELNGKKIDYLPASAEDQQKIKPIYKIFKGWKSSTKGIKNLKILPDNAKNYISYLEKFIETKNFLYFYKSRKKRYYILIEDPFNNLICWK